MSINPVTISPIISLVFALFLGIFTVCKNPRGKLNWLFLGQCITIIVWLSFYIGYYFDLSYEQKLFSAKFIYCGITFLPIFYFSYTMNFLNLPKIHLWEALNYTCGFIFCLLILKTNLIISGIYNFPWGYYPKADVLHPVLLIFFTVLLFIPVKNLIKESRKQEKKKNLYYQIKYLLIGYSIFIFASIDFIPNYGINLFPVGSIAASVCLVFISYAIFKYEFMDIKIIIRKGAIYTCLLAVITLTYFFLILVFERYFQEHLNYQTTNSILAILVISLIFNPLRNKIQFLIEKKILKSSSLEAIEQHEQLRIEVANAEKLRAVATLASGLAHEIRNPLTTISTFAQYIPQKKNDPQFLDQCHRTLTAETNRVNELLNQLLAFAKPSPPCFEPVEPHKILDDILVLTSFQTDKNKIKVVKNYETTHTISADPAQLKQAFLNIILNAIEVMPNGGTLTVGTSRDNNSYVISIADTGPGIDPKDLKHIFDPFFSKKQGGTGLGLAVTHGIIEQHKGYIKVHSEKYKGTKFSLFFVEIS